ncbi:MAG: hypothetical protein U1F47_02265 [Hyphomicrobiales bacterium]
MQRDGGERRASAARFALIACDEGMGDDEMVPPALAERLAFHLQLDGLGVRPTAPDRCDIDP